MSIIELLDVSMSFSTTEQRIDLFQNLSLKIESGSFVLLLGKSGSGKSTLLNLIAGFTSPSSGKIIVSGRDVSELGPKESSDFRNKEIGYIFQFFNLVDCFNAIENVMAPMLIAGMDKPGAQERAKMLLEQVGLDDRCGHFVHQLSGGEQQRVAIARALACNPDIILADEPTGNLDEKTSIGVLDILSKLHDEGKTIVMVSHDVDIADRATRVVNVSDLK